MKCIIFVDSLASFGGGERLIYYLAKILKVKTIITTNYNPNLTYDFFKKFNIEVVFPAPRKSGYIIQAILKILYRIKIYLTANRIKKRYPADLYIGIGHFVHYFKPDIWYCLSPPRSWYDLYPYFLIHKYKKFYRRILFKFYRLISVLIDKYIASKINHIWVISKEVSRRVKKYYNREPEAIIYPSVKIPEIRVTKRGNYFLLPSRILPVKRIDLIVEVFKKTKEKLVICGSENIYGQQLKELIKGAKNIDYLGPASERELNDLYLNSKAVLSFGINEDFGLIPIEANAFLKPVICPNEGGFKETVINKKTGFLIDKPYSENLLNLINQFDEFDFNPKILRKNAERFDFINFRKKVEKEIKKIFNSYGK